MEPSLEDGIYKAILDNIDWVVTPQDETSPSPQNGVCIPQRMYRRGAGRGSVNNQGLVLFLREDGSFIPVDTALRKEYTGLICRDVPALTEAGGTVTLRFEWPGYPPHEYQLRMIDWRTPFINKMPLGSLATEVAKCVDKFVKKMEVVSVAPEDAQWEIGPTGIQTKDLRLAALEQVTAGSWQIRLFYKPTN